MKLLNAFKNMPKKEKLLTGAELFLIVAALVIAASYLIQHNINNPAEKKGLSGYPIKVYALSENPQFDITPQEIGIGSKDIDVKVEHSTGVPVDITVNKTKKANGDYEVILQHSEKFRPGMYVMVVTGDEDTIYRNFYWGVLAVNTNKSVYRPGEEAFLQLGVLDQWGHTLCDANLKLEVIDPKNNSKTLEVKNSPSCGRDNVVETADYTSYYKTGGAGTYTIILTNLNNNFVLATQFKVENNPAFSVERVGAMRINPFKADSYLMTIKVKASKNFSGTLEEYLPKSFKADGQDANKISWNIDLAAGEEKVLTYRYTAPSLSPQFYLLGPIRILANGIEVFRESRAWQIASDAVKTASASGSWETNLTWGVTSPPPVAGDTVTIGNFNITVGANESASSINISASGANVEVRSGYTLQLTSAFVVNNLDAAMSAALSGPGTINVPVLQIGNNTTVTAAREVRLWMNTGTINITSNFVIRSDSGAGAALVESAYANIQTGTVNVSSSVVTFFGRAAGRAGIVMNTGGQTGTLNLSGSPPWSMATLGVNSMVLTGTTAVVNYKGTGYQTLPSSSANTYTTMKVNNSAGVALSGSVTATNLTIGDATASSVYIDSGFSTISTGTLNLTSGTYKLGGAAATTFPLFTTRNISAGTTVEYQAAVAQTVSSAPPYSNLTFSGAGTKTTTAGTLTVTSTWAVNATTALNTNNTIVSASEFTGTGAVTQGTGNISLNGNWLNTGAFTAGSASVIFTGTSKIISGPAAGLTFGGLRVNGTITDAYGSGTITVNSALSGTGTLTQNSAPTTLTIKGDAIITNLIASAPSNTVIFSGTNQSITGSYSFYNLSLTGTGTRTITFTGGTTTSVAAGGTLTCSGAASNLLSLVSSNTSAWNLYVNSSASTSLSYINASSSNAAGYKQILAPKCLGNRDGGGNSNWYFPDCAGTMNIDGVDIQGLDLVK